MDTVLVLEVILAVVVDDEEPAATRHVQSNVHVLQVQVQVQAPLAVTTMYHGRPTDIMMYLPGL